MNNRFLNTQALVIKRFNYNEADRILTLYTRGFGKISVIAKGVRKLQSRKRGNVELFNYVKFQVVNSKGFPILTDVVSLNNFPQMRIELDKVKSAYYLCELVDKLLPDGEPNNEVFSLLVKSFQALNSDMVEVDVLVNYFKHRMVRLLGFWPSDNTVPQNINSLIDNILEQPLGSVKGWDIKSEIASNLLDSI